MNEAAKRLTPEIAERVMRHFKDGTFEFDFDTEGHVAVEGNTVYHIIPRYAQDEASRKSEIPTSTVKPAWLSPRRF